MKGEGKEMVCGEKESRDGWRGVGEREGEGEREKDGELTHEVDY